MGKTYKDNRNHVQRDAARHVFFREMKKARLTRLELRQLMQAHEEAELERLRGLVADALDKLDRLVGE